MHPWQAPPSSLQGREASSGRAVTRWRDPQFPVTTLPWSDSLSVHCVRKRWGNCVLLADRGEYCRSFPASFSFAGAVLSGHKFIGLLLAQLFVILMRDTTELVGVGIIKNDSEWIWKLSSNTTWFQLEYFCLLSICRHESCPLYPLHHLHEPQTRIAIRHPPSRGMTAKSAAEIPVEVQERKP